MTNYGRSGREVLRRMVEFHQLWLRDLLRARYGAPREELVNRDRETEIRRQAEHAEPAEIRRRLLVLEEMLRTIEGNVTPELAMFSALSRLGGEHFEADSWPPHPTARWDYCRRSPARTTAPGPERRPPPAAREARRAAPSAPAGRVGNARPAALCSPQSPSIPGGFP